VADIYARRYGVGLQDVMYGSNYMPDGDVMFWIEQLAYWLDWYDNVQETCAMFKEHCPDHIKDEPREFNQWVKAQQQKEQSINPMQHGFKPTKRG